MGRRSRRVSLVILIVVVLFAGATARLFVFPDTNAPTHADAIFVLGGDGDRAGEGYTLARAHDAPLTFFSINPDSHCPALSGIGRYTCFVPNPFTTQGEARSIHHLAQVNHLHRIILVTTTPQATRARLRVGRCFKGQIEVVGVSPGSVVRWIHDIAYEWGALFKALALQRGC